MVGISPRVHLIISLIITILNEISVVIEAQSVQDRFEYKYSLKPPILIENEIPFWKSGGNLILDDKKIRLASSVKSQKGAVWTERMVNFDSWKVDLAFHISGKGTLGADGLAFWYTTSSGDYNGEVYGSSDKWIGLGLFFDSYDNDNKRDNPKIMAIVNDGTIAFDHANDGGKHNIAECIRDFRNKPYVTRAVIQYHRNSLQVYFHNGNSNSPDGFEFCFRKDNVFLPKNGYFGVSAATGELADDHDLYHVLTYSLHEGTTQEPPKNSASQQEYERYQKVLDEKQKAFLKEHPDVAKVLEQQRMMYEMPVQMSLGQVNEFLAKMYDVVISMDQKITAIINTQKIGQNSGEGGSQVADAMLTNNINSLLYLSKETMSILNELKNKMSNNLDDKIFIEVRDSVNNVKHLSHQILLKQQSANACPVANCLTFFHFLIAISLQCVIVIAVIYYRYQKESKAKKLF